jgi:hypothetical protein
MADRLEKILEEHLAHLRKVTAMMQTGTMSTRSGNRNTTQETVAENLVHIANLENALRDHRTRNA